MRKILAVLICLVPAAASAQQSPIFIDTPLPPQTVIGNIGSIGSSASAIPFSTLLNGLGGNQSANTVWSGPTSGGLAAPTFRALVGADLPAPGVSTLGGVRSIAQVSHQWINSISSFGIPSASQPACGDLSNAAASCSTDTTNAANIGTGTLSSLRLPTPFTSGTASGNTAQFATVLAGTKTSGHVATWDGAGNIQDQGTTASITATPASPTGTTSGTGVMMGLGSTCKLTPGFSGRVLLMFSGTGANSTATDSWIASVRFGTGTAPANAAALSGTVVGNGTAGTSTAAAQGTPFGGIGGIITGLTVGTQVWFDMGLSATPAGTASLTTLTCTAMEF